MSLQLVLLHRFKKELYSKMQRKPRGLRCIFCKLILVLA